MSLSRAESALLALSDPPETSTELVKAACSADITRASSVSHLHGLVRARNAAGGLEFGVDWTKANSFDELDLVSLAALCLHAYAQANFTGPAVPVKPCALFGQGEVTEGELNDAAVDALATGGEPAYHLSTNTAYLVIALQLLGLLTSPFDKYERTFELESAKIWKLRAAFVWIRVLDEPVPIEPRVVEEAKALRDRLEQHSPERAHLSLTLAQLAFHMSRSLSQSSSQKEASEYAQDAAREGGLEWRLTGHLGKRTKFQIEDKTQLVVLAKDGSSNVDVSKAKSKLPEALALNDDTLLDKTAFTESNGEAENFGVDPAAPPKIEAFSQAALLALSLATLPQITSLVHLSADVLTTSQVTAFVARVLEQPQNWSVHSMALLLRSRAESGRSRTVERGVLQMQALVDQLKDGTSELSAISSAVKPEDMAPARERLCEFHSLLIPPIWDMERELALRYINLGVTKSALDIFTRLEMWEEVARCWTTLSRPDRGIEVIKSLLGGRRLESDETMLQRKEQRGSSSVWRGGEKREAKLWCTLGELEQDPSHFEKAWEVSKHTSSRAMRSLGAVFWAKQQFERASEALSAGLRINPLYHRTWFVLGCCEMKLERWSSAQDAFTRCVALEDEDAEAWSNLASCHLRRGEVEGDQGLEPSTSGGHDDDEQTSIQRLPFSRKRAAFQCLRQAVKYSYDSWRVWYNYMIVAVDVGEMSEACRAQSRIVEIRAERDGVDCVDLGVLERLVDAVTRVHETSDSNENVPGHVDPNVGRGLEPRVRRLITELILVKIPSFSQVHALDARLAFWRGDYQHALASHLRAYRTSVAVSDQVETDEKAFVEGCMAVRSAVEALENFGGRTVVTEDGKEEAIAKDWKFQARSLVRTYLGKTKDSFEDHDEYEKLRELLSELK